MKYLYEIMVDSKIEGRKFGRVFRFDEKPTEEVLNLLGKELVKRDRDNVLVGTFTWKEVE